MTFPHLLLALTTIFLWGFNFVVIKLGVAGMPPLLLTLLRYLFAAVPLVFFLPRPNVAWRVMVLYGMTMGFGQFALLFPAIKLGLPAGLASLVIQSQAFFTIALAALFLGEKPLRSQLVGAGVAFCGLAVIGAERMTVTALVPLVMCIGAAISWACGNIVNRQMGKVDVLAFIAWTSLVPILPLAVLSLALEGPQAIGSALNHISVTEISAIAYLAYAATIIGAGIWSFLLSRYPAGTVAPFSLLVPIVGMTSAYLVLSERVTPLEMLGGVLVIAGLLLNVFGRRLPGFSRPA